MGLEGRLVRCVTVLLDEAFEGPPGRQWFTDSHAEAGLFWTLDAVPATGPPRLRGGVG